MAISKTPQQRAVKPIARRISATRSDDAIAALRASLLEEIREQCEFLREEIADRDSQIFSLLQELRTQDSHREPPAATLANGDEWEYQQMTRRLLELVCSAVPEGATIAVVSKGDPELLNLENRVGWHFPRFDDGAYTGFYPKDGQSAVRELQHVYSQGARYLVFPASGLWWLEHYPELARFLHDHAEIAARDNRVCAVFAFKDVPPQRVHVAPPPPPPDEDESHLAAQVRAVVAGILPPHSQVLVVGKGDPAMVQLGRCVGLHFPQDREGEYAGFHPADSEAAIRHLEELRGRGAQYIVFPKSSGSWFSHYADFRKHLETRYRAVVRQRHVCTIFDLNGR